MHTRRKRGHGRPRLRLIDGILDDVKVLGVKTLWTLVNDRDVWRKILRAAEPHGGMYVIDDDVSHIDSRVMV